MKSQQEVNLLLKLWSESEERTTEGWLSCLQRSVSLLEPGVWRARQHCAPLGFKASRVSSPLVPEVLMHTALPGERVKARSPGHFKDLKLLALVSVCIWCCERLALRFSECRV